MVQDEKQAKAKLIAHYNNLKTIYNTAAQHSQTEAQRLFEHMAFFLGMCQTSLEKVNSYESIQLLLANAAEQEMAIAQEINELAKKDINVAMEAHHIATQEERCKHLPGQVI